MDSQKKKIISTDGKYIYHLKRSKASECIGCIMTDDNGMCTLEDEKNYNFFPKEEGCNEPGMEQPDWLFIKKSLVIKDILKKL